MLGIQAIGAYVRDRRKARALTQAELANLAGVARTVVVAVEQGKPTLRIDSVERVLNVFGRTLGAVERPIDPTEDTLT